MIYCDLHDWKSSKTYNLNTLWLPHWLSGLTLSVIFFFQIHITLKKTVSNEVLFGLMCIYWSLFMPSTNLRPSSHFLHLSCSWVSRWRCGAAAGQRSHSWEDWCSLIGGGHPENQWPHHWGEGPPQRWCLRPHYVQHALVYSLIKKEGVKVARQWQSMSN